MHWAAYRHHPQGGLADHHCLFERAGLITQPECHWGGLISQFALVYSIYTYYHLNNNNYYHLIISQQQLTLSYYHTTKYHATKWDPKRCMYRQDRCVRDFFASVFFIKLHQNREVLIGMHCIESLQGVLCMRKLILKEGLFERMAVYKTYKLAVFSSCCFVHLRWWSFSWFIFRGGREGGSTFYLMEFCVFFHKAVTGFLSCLVS